MAGGLGFEPRFSDPKSDVLPLDDPPTEVQDKDCGLCSQVRSWDLGFGIWDLGFGFDSLKDFPIHNPMSIIWDINEQAAEVQLRQLGCDLIFRKCREQGIIKIPL